MDELDTMIQEILENDSPFAYSFITYITGRLSQFHLYTRIEAHDVVSIAYRRTREYLDSGKKINNIQAFFKKVCLNIIREKSRSLKKELLFDDEFIFYKSIFIEDYCLEDINQDISKIKKALIYLKRERIDEYELIFMRFYENKSFREISSFYQDHTNTLVSESTLRQRTRRAIKHLHKIFHKEVLNI